MNSLYRILSVLIPGLLFAAGCGQKGPLYLPGDPSEIRQEVPRQDESRPEDEDDEEREDN